MPETRILRATPMVNCDTLRRPGGVVSNESHFHMHHLNSYYLYNVALHCKYMQTSGSFGLKAFK